MTTHDEQASGAAEAGYRFSGLHHTQLEIGRAHV